MVVKDSEGTQITQNIPVTIDKTTGKITITVDNEKIEGSYELEIVKVDGKTNAPVSYTHLGETETSDYKLLNQDKEEVSQGITVEDLVGENFYI